MEDQQKAAFPLCKVTETLWYNHRLLIDSAVYGEDSEVRAWLISKVNRISPNGICRITLAQDTFDQHRDYIERDENGIVIGMWADYYKSAIEPTPFTPSDGDDTTEPSPEPSTTTATIICSGKQQIKVGGSAKTLTAIFYDVDGNTTDLQIGDWDFTIDNEDVVSLLNITEIESGKIKIKFIGNDDYIGKVLMVTYTSSEAVATLNLEILPL